MCAYVLDKKREMKWIKEWVKHTWSSPFLHRSSCFSAAAAASAELDQNSGGWNPSHTSFSSYEHYFRLFLNPEQDWSCVRITSHHDELSSENMTLKLVWYPLHFLCASFDNSSLTTRPNYCYSFNLRRLPMVSVVTENQNKSIGVR